MLCAGVMMITAEQCRQARGALGWGIRELAKRASISATTVTRFENGLSKSNKVTLLAIQRALEQGGVEFIDGDEPGIRVRTRK
jgi:transcriptional regulator with XRE-family HTH domain